MTKIFTHEFTLGKYDSLPLIYFGSKNIFNKKNCIFFWKSTVSGSLYTIQGVKKIIVYDQAHFLPFLKTPAEKNGCHILKTVLKVGNLMLTQNIFFYLFKINVTAARKKIVSF